MPTIGESIGGLEHEFLVGRAEELGFFREWLARPGLHPLLKVTGPGGIGKSALLAAFRRMALVSGRAVLSVDMGELSAAVPDFLNVLHARDPAELAELLNGRASLLLIDRFEHGFALTPFLQEELLPRLDLGVRIVISGRYPMGRAWTDHPVWGRLVWPLDLRGLTPRDAARYLTKRGITDPASVEQVLAAVGGHPLALSLAADMLEHLGLRNLTDIPEWRVVMRSLVEQVLTDVKPDLVELLEAGSVVRQFDEDTLAEVAGVPDVRDAFAVLCRLSVVQAAAHGLSLHEDVRRMVADDLAWRQPTRFEQLRRNAVRHYRRRMHEAPRDERGWLVAERLYLWQDALMHRALFREGGRGRVWLDQLRPGDQPALVEMAVGRADVLMVDLPAGAGHEPSAVDRRLAEAVIGHPATRVRVARDRDGTLLGFSAVVPLSNETFALLERGRGLPAALAARLSDRRGTTTCADPADSDTRLLYQVAHVKKRGDAVESVLFEDMFAVLAEGGLFFAIVNDQAYQRILEAIGFRRIDTPGGEERVSSPPGSTYELDLRQLGVEGWMDLLLSGQGPWEPPRPTELEAVVQAVLVHWRDDRWLERCPLRALAGIGTDPTPDRIRELVLEALEVARASKGAGISLAAEAVEQAYIHRVATHERIAERLSVSRSTLYRLLRRGAREISGVLIEVAFQGGAQRGRGPAEADPRPVLS